ncbi:MAG: RNA polymerase Rpb4 family protein [Methanosarcinales archaeon]|nr:RNA polymerase Rpb4 family protein [ANME-2 cluster archaeon]MDW7775450.1 RNA polymerase Rpb4 family protein [Methanosarcinales archaeon]
MIVKQVFNEEMLTIAEAKEILVDIRETRTEKELELGYELKRAINHAENSAKTDGASSRKLVEELLKLEKMKPDIAFRLADIMPTSFDEIRSIYAKERFTLSEFELTQILDTVAAAY